MKFFIKDFFSKFNPNLQETADIVTSRKFYVQAENGL